MKSFLRSFLWGSLYCLLAVAIAFNIGAKPVIADSQEIIVEWLQFSVPENEQELFIEKELEIWEPVNRRSPSYIGKEIWQNDKQSDQVTMINYWHGKNHRQNITPDMIEKAEKDFDLAVGKIYEILESKTFKQLITDDLHF